MGHDRRVAGGQVNDATRILAEFKRALDEHFGLNPVKPEHRPSQDTLNRFAELTREEDWKQKIEDELQSLKRRLVQLEGKS